ncbi:unnamed protein product [Rhizophagus irregularis]|nr:unnamed protein product [Rhizophagus irregularis]
MSSYEPTDIRQRAAKTIEIQEPLLDGGDSNVQQRINQVLEKDTLKRKIFYISLLALLSMLLIFIYLQYYIPFTKKASPPKYSSWNTDDTLKKFIPIATFMGLIGVVGLLFSFWHIWGFFGTPLVIFSALKSIIHIINIL